MGTKEKQARLWRHEIFWMVYLLGFGTWAVVSLVNHLVQHKEITILVIDIVYLLMVLAIGFGLGSLQRIQRIKSAAMRDKWERDEYMLQEEWLRTSKVKEASDGGNKSGRSKSRSKKSS